MKTKEIPLEILRQPKIIENEEIVSFTSTYKWKRNENFFPKIKQNISKIVPTFFRRRNVLNIRAKHLIFENYSVGLSLNYNTKKNTKWKIAKSIASAALIF